LKTTEIIGTIASVIFAAVVIVIFASNPPLYAYWGNNLNRLSNLGVSELGAAIGRYIWRELFPAMIAFLMVLIALILGVSALLRRE
jgi:hypothetical protein